MDLLLDTHPFIWFLNGDDRLSPKLKKIIADTSNKCFLSIASLWEIAIKSRLGKLELKGDFTGLQASSTTMILRFCPSRLSTFNN